MSDLLNRLLGAPSVKDLPAAKLELPRLGTKENPFVVTVRVLDWKRLGELHGKDSDDAKLKLILAACPELNQPFTPPEDGGGLVTAEDVLQAKLLPGEIDRIVDEIDRLCGYRGRSIVKEIKN